MTFMFRRERVGFDRLKGLSLLRLPLADAAAEQTSKKGLQYTQPRDGPNPWVL